MDRDTIIRLAREAGDNLNKEWLVRFAALVAAHEREECAKVVEMTPFQFDDYKRIAAAIRSRT